MCVRMYILGKNAYFIIKNYFRFCADKKKTKKIIFLPENVAKFSQKGGRNEPLSLNILKRTVVYSCRKIKCQRRKVTI